MKRPIIVLPLIAVLAGCTSTSTPAPKKPAAEPQAPVEAPPSKPREPVDTETLRARAALEKGYQVSPLSPPGSAEDQERATAPTTFFDQKLNIRVQRVPKSARGYFADKGKLYFAAMSNLGLLIVREDENAWYVPAPPERGSEAAKKAEEESIGAPGAMTPVIPESEAEAVATAISRTRLRFEEISEGLPTAGFWRENMTVADLDGDGKLEIIAPPARLTAGGLKIWRLEGNAWKPVQAVFDVPKDSGLTMDYGGVTAVDLNGDGRPDLVWVSHGNNGGPAIAYNLGGFRFRVETGGMPRSISSRAVDVGDIDGDGQLDIISIADQSEYMRARQDERNKGALMPDASGFVPGYDVRAFFGQPGGKFVENHVGLGDACYGNTIALWANPPDGGEPFFASGCRYVNRTMVIYGFDKGTKSFHRVGLEFPEAWSFHSGVALGLYHGFPAAFMTYSKTGPQSATPNISSAGVSIYYREKGEWKRKRLVKKLLERPADSQGIGVGDLNGDGLDDVVYADDLTHRVRIFFQTPAGEFEEMDPALEPTYENRSTCVKIADVDGDGRKDIVLMFQTATGERTRVGGLRFFRNLGPER